MTEPPRLRAVPPVEADVEAEADEHALVGRALDGDHHAFSLLVRRHHTAVRTFVGAHVRGAAADDVAQEAFISAYRRLHTFDRARPLRPWLLGIARFATLKYLRDRDDALVDDVLVDRTLARRAEQELAARDDVVQIEGELAALQACIGELPEVAASLVRRHYVEAQSLAAIAAEKSRGESAVRMQLLRIRDVLRECVQRRLAEAGA